MEDEVFENDSANNVDYLIVFGPNRSDVNMTEPSSDLYVLQEENKGVTSDLKSAFGAEVHHHSNI